MYFDKPDLLNNAVMIEKGCIVKINFKERGAALVEFALVSVIFFTVLFSIIEFGYLFWGNLSMQHAVREGSRFAVVTGFDPAQPDPIEDRCDRVKNFTQDSSMGFYDRVSPVVTFRTINAAGNVVNIGSGCGAAQQVVVIHIDCTLPLITPFTQLLGLMGGSSFTNGEYKFSVSTTMRNEAFK
ncbi:MAG: pilus assembly protein [Methylotenera sp.]|nr:pilus assembly protein [Methylotenera sp.]MDO9232504.1 pilus assembly protein [Methylotenera sp.]MDO9388763.1 pilus assembly protein [Methylotenera sp.]MDP2403525.1 pilus assembly protein [Methylotenera sp.]MDP3095650.1 pilus assembly protein [Methylotenera sp.]